jgi:(1->4)-alpha-D-glucan 1-alpha-D-glucosylmutase
MRARLNVLSEIPEEWDARLGRWMEWNQSKHANVGGVLVPSVAEEILIYQTLLGAWPNRAEEEAEFGGRMAEYLVKVLREAKQNSSWISPRVEYEKAVQQFAEGIFEDDTPFVQDFHEFRRSIAEAGARNGLGQLLLKIAAPGVPDFFQGTEFWQFSLVDPDNRRPVDYERRMTMLENLRRRMFEDRIGLIRDLARNPLLDEMKLFVTHRALEFRKSSRELFARGEYLPLTAIGACAEHVCAFARRLGSHWAVVVTPRWTYRLSDWADTVLELPRDAPGQWEDALTGLIPPSWRLQDLLAEFPVAMLTNAG